MEIVNRYPPTVRNYTFMSRVYWLIATSMVLIQLRYDSLSAVKIFIIYAVLKLFISAFWFMLSGTNTQKTLFSTYVGQEPNQLNYNRFKRHFWIGATPLLLAAWFLSLSHAVILFAFLCATKGTLSYIWIISHQAHKS